MKVLLNGKEVEPTEIDPIKHKFIGTFRRPVPPINLHPEYEYCPCSCYCSPDLKWMNVTDFFKQHWQRGCYDVPQYSDI